MLFSADELPEFPEAVKPKRNGIRHPLWTKNKALLIQEYIRLFTFITKHGVYIDGFAAPQRRDKFDMCSANLVLSNEPQWVRRFFLCDLDPVGIEKLNQIAAHHAAPKRKIEVISGDFNATIDGILSSGAISEKTATFALLDQRTFECAWSTVERIARHKSGMKIELFYFFASGWIDRSLAAATKPEKIGEIQRWWGRDDWHVLRDVQGHERATLLTRRFIEELGYADAVPFAIHSRGRNGRIMYHMIHATDHPEAIKLMLRAYRKVSGRADIDRELTQADLVDHLNEMVAQDNANA